MSLNYNNVDEELLKILPELRPLYDRELESWKGQKPGQYIIFEDLLRSYILPLLDSRENDEVMRRIFGFFESMAESEDIQVVNLLQVGELEFLITRSPLLSMAWRYMGEKTKALTRETAKIWHYEKNLPD